MTREEAVQGWIIPAIKNTWNEKKCQEIIKALEQEPSVWDDKGELTEYGEKCREHILEQEPCDDAVSRQAAIDAVRFGITHAIRINRYTGEKDDLFQASNDELEKAIERIEELPSVSVAEKTGHWIEDENEMIVWCSICGEEHEECSKFCPNCGHRMVEPQESEEV